MIILPIERKKDAIRRAYNKGHTKNSSNGWKHAWVYRCKTHSAQIEKKSMKRARARLERRLARKAINDLAIDDDSNVYVSIRLNGYDVI